MSIESIVAAAQSYGAATAEARMQSRATVRRKTGGTTTGPDGLEVDAWEVVHADIPVRRTDARARSVTIGDSTSFPQATGWDHFPHDTDLSDGDYIEITSGEWAGTVERVIKALSGDQQTARRVPVEATARPEEWT